MSPQLLTESKFEARISAVLCSGPGSTSPPISMTHQPFQQWQGQTSIACSEEAYVTAAIATCKSQSLGSGVVAKSGET